MSRFAPRPIGLAMAQLRDGVIAGALRTLDDRELDAQVFSGVDAELEQGFAAIDATIVEVPFSYENFKG